jgi:hypothetical protein
MINNKVYSYFDKKKKEIKKRKIKKSLLGPNQSSSIQALHHHASKATFKSEVYLLVSATHALSTFFFIKILYLLKDQGVL